MSQCKNAFNLSKIDRAFSSLASRDQVPTTLDLHHMDRLSASNTVRIGEVGINRVNVTRSHVRVWLPSAATCIRRPDIGGRSEDSVATGFITQSRYVNFIRYIARDIILSYCYRYNRGINVGSLWIFTNIFTILNSRSFLLFFLFYLNDIQDKYWKYSNI